MVTSKDVAKLAGVSHATVSRVFVSPEMVSDKVIEKVYKAASELNYVPNSLASGLKNTKSNNVGLIISNLKNSFFTRVAYGIQKHLYEKGVNLLIGLSNEDINEEKESIALHLSYRTSTILFTPSSYDGELERRIKLFNNVRFIQLFRNCYEETDSIVIDDRKGTQLLTEEFLKRGHSKILLLDGESSLPTYRDLGYRDAFNNLNISIDDRYIVQLQFENNKEKIKLLIDELQPTGIIAVSEIGLAHVVEVLSEMNIEIGDDISLASYDDSYIARTLNLTSIGHDEDYIIDTIINHLNEIVYVDSNSHFHIKIDPILIKRESIKTL